VSRKVRYLPEKADIAAIDTRSPIAAQLEELGCIYDPEYIHKIQQLLSAVSTLYGAKLISKHVLYSCREKLRRRVIQHVLGR